MESEGKNKRTGKPFIIANPIYDTVFKRLMENQRIAKFFLGTIFEQPIEGITVTPKKFTYRFDSSKVSNKKKKKEPYTDKEKDIKEQNKAIKEKDKKLEEKDKRIAKLERLFRDKQVE
jgi:predicted transcriptional regulator